MKKREMERRITKLEARIEALEARPQVSYTPYDTVRFDHAAPTIIHPDPHCTCILGGQGASLLCPIHGAATYTIGSYQPYYVSPEFT